MVIPLRADSTDESEGLDITQHGEEAYIHGGGLSSISAHAEVPRTGPGMASVPVR
jgi:hypothetical protein